MQYNKCQLKKSPDIMSNLFTYVWNECVNSN